MKTPTPIPEWLTLTSGAHRGRCGVCLEECYAVLVHDTKTDAPSDVHPIIRSLGIAANDRAVSDEDRTQLAATLGCQRDTNDSSITTPLAVFAIRWVLDHLAEGAHSSIPAALDAAATCLDDPSDENRARAAGAARAARATEAAWAAGAARAAEAAGAARAARAAEAAWAAGAAGAARAAEAAGAARAARAAEAAWAAGAAWAAEAAWAAGAGFSRDLFLAVIDEAERLLGRTECWVPSDEDWERVRAAL